VLEAPGRETSHSSATTLIGKKRACRFGNSPRMANVRSSRSRLCGPARPGAPRVGRAMPLQYPKAALLKLEVFEAAAGR